MRIAVAGSIATDHLFTFDGRFVDVLLPDQLGNLSLSFLASDLQVRRGGTGANIAFGMGMLGARPVLVGAVGRDAGDYLSWLERHGVDVSAVRVSELLATARFTCTTDRDQSQLATFYPGAMVEAAQLDLGDVHGQAALDLVVVAPDDPTAMQRHTAWCRERGLPFAADPSQQLSFMDGDAIRSLVEGAAYLFTNEYEAGLVREKTGWTADDVLGLVGTRVTTHGARGVVVERKGEDAVRVPVVPARTVADPTGVGDAFRAGFLTATGWGLDLERACQVGALLATHVVETVGTQEYSFTASSFAARLAEAYGDDAAAEVEPHLAG
ncbi:MAG TPA: carbohydrate kinase family protein [Mycobacteriales bacterium]|nr:carbohydrate kinase family protein [Mycobacteriales bacterium]